MRVRARVEAALRRLARLRIRLVTAVVAGVVIALAITTLNGCSGSSGGHTADRRAWFGAFVATMLTDPQLRGTYQLAQAAEPYVGACRRHRAYASWQATLHSVGDSAQRSYAVSQQVQSSIVRDSQLGSGAVTVIPAGGVSGGATAVDTVLLIPGGGSELQVSVPQGSSVLITGYLSC